MLFINSCAESAAVLGGQSRSLKTAPKKDGQGLVTRRALNDITNKSSSVGAEVHPKKKDAGKKEVHVADHKEFNIAEERFLHDHSKCVEAQQTALNAFRLDLVLPGSGNSLSISLQSNVSEIHNSWIKLEANACVILESNFSVPSVQIPCADQVIQTPNTQRKR